jgi:hypothetical protein
MRDIIRNTSRADITDWHQSTWLALSYAVTVPLARAA